MLIMKSLLKAALIVDILLISATVSSASEVRKGLFEKARADASVAETKIGYSDGRYCAPFACLGSILGKDARYQQVYSANAFKGKQYIDSIAFYVDSGYSGFAMDSATYDVKIYSSNRKSENLSSVASDNIGKLISDFGKFSFSGSIDPKIVLKGDLFSYDPSKDGDILIDIVMTQLNKASGKVAPFSADTRSQWTSSAFFGKVNGVSNWGAVTGFFNSQAATGSQDVVAVPGPEAGAGVISIALAGLFFMRRNGRKTL